MGKNRLHECGQTLFAISDGKDDVNTVNVLCGVVERNDLYNIDIVCKVSNKYVTVNLSTEILAKIKQIMRW